MTGTSVWLRSTILATLLLLTAASLAIAQTIAPGRPGSPEFARLVDGKDVIVTMADGREYSGIFAVEQSALVSRTSRGMTTLAFDQITRVQKNSYRIRLHSLIGVGVGASVGVLMLTSSSCDFGCDGELFYLVVAGAGIGAGIGTGVGGILNAANAQKDLIYDSNRRTAMAWRIAPILSPLKRGIAFTFSWR